MTPAISTRAGIPIPSSPRSETDQFLFNQGNHRQLFDVLGHRRTAVRTASPGPPSQSGLPTPGAFRWSGTLTVGTDAGTPYGCWARRHLGNLVPGVGEVPCTSLKSSMPGGPELVTDPFFGTLFELPPKHAAVVWEHPEVCLDR